MRQRLGKKKVLKYRAQTGLDVIAGLVRGNTGHRVDLCLRNGSVVSLFPDGSVYECGGCHCQKSVLDEDHNGRNQQASPPDTQ